MPHRHRLVVVVVLLLSLKSNINGQAPVVRASAPKPTVAWTPPRTADGHPDLQGIWLNNDATPLERPKALEGKPFLTDEELATLKKNAARLFNSSLNSDFAGGDNFFLGALANPEIFKNRDATGGIDNITERLFDNRTSLIVSPTDGRIPMTAAGQKRRAAAAEAGFLAPRSHPPEGPEDVSSFIRCITYGTPRLGGAAASYHNYYQIVQTPRFVILLSEAFHDARIIPIDGRPHLPEQLRLWHGDSRGRWEGDTLIVDTTNFSPKSGLLGSAENLHAIERFTRVAPDQIKYEITLSDPTSWTQPWTAIVRLHESAEKIYEDACHEGNEVVMRAILAGARADEMKN